MHVYCSGGPVNSAVLLILLTMTRRARKTCFVLIVGIAAVLSVPNSVFACTCFDLSSIGKTEKQLIKAERKKSQAIFAGEVTKIIVLKTASGTNSGMVEIHFKVSQAWKGIKSQAVTIFTTNIPDICGYEFEVDEHYLIYAFTFPSNKDLHTTICTRTQKMSTAVADLKVLGKGIILNK
jgi:hypothetical protein